MRCPVIWSTQVCTYSSANERQQDCQKGERDPVEPVETASRDVAIDRDFHQVRLRKLQHRRGDDRRECDADLQPVRPEVRHQAPHQGRVVGFPEDFFVVD